MFGFGDTEKIKKMEAQVNATHLASTKLRYEILRLEELVDDWMDVALQRQGIIDKLKSSRAKIVEDFVFDGKDIKRLLHLAHPDKHNNSVMSQRATRLLLEMRSNLCKKSY